MTLTIAQWLFTALGAITGYATTVGVARSILSRIHSADCRRGEPRPFAECDCHRCLRYKGTTMPCTCGTPGIWPYLWPFLLIGHCIWLMTQFLVIGPVKRAHAIGQSIGRRLR